MDTAPMEFHITYGALPGSSADVVVTTSGNGSARGFAALAESIRTQQGWRRGLRLLLREEALECKGLDLDESRGIGEQLADLALELGEGGAIAIVAPADLTIEVVECSSYCGRILPRRATAGAAPIMFFEDVDAATAWLDDDGRAGAHWMPEAMTDLHCQACGSDHADVYLIVSLPEPNPGAYCGDCAEEHRIVSFDVYFAPGVG